MLIQLKMKLHLWAELAAVLLRGPFDTIGKEWDLARLSQLMFAKRFGNENCCAALSHAVVTVEKWSVSSLGIHLDALWRAAGACGLSVEFILATITGPSTRDLNTIDCSWKSEVLGGFASRPAC